MTVTASDTAGGAGAPTTPTSTGQFRHSTASTLAWITLGLRRQEVGGMVHADLEAMDRRIRALDDEELRKELSFAEAAGLEAHDNAGHWLLLTMERDRRQREQQ